MKRLAKWIISVIGRWRKKDIRTKDVQDNYRKYDDNTEKLENGESL